MHDPALGQPTGPCHVERDTPPTRVPEDRGKSGYGANGAMAQINKDDRVSAAASLDRDEQIRSLWHAQAQSDRNPHGIHSLHEWLLREAPELLQGHDDGYEYLAKLLCKDVLE